MLLRDYQRSRVRGGQAVTKGQPNRITSQTIRHSDELRWGREEGSRAIAGSAASKEAGREARHASSEGGKTGRQRQVWGGNVHSETQGTCTARTRYWKSGNQNMQAGSAFVQRKRFS